MLGNPFDWGSNARMSKSQLLKTAYSVDVMARLKRLRKILEIGDWSLERVRLKLRLASFSKTYGTAESHALPQSIKRLRKMAPEL
jgi:hypothetical protein